MSRAATPAGSSSSSSAGSTRVSSASGSGPRKVAHTSLQHARHNAPPPAVSTAGLQDPFSVYGAKLAALDAQFRDGKLATHHLVVDCVRVLEDVLVHAAQTFLEHRHPPLLLALTVDHAQAGVAERLRDAEVLSPWQNRQIDDARKLARWVLASSAREVPTETARNCLVLVTQLARQFLSDVTRAAEARPQPGCSAGHAFCRDMNPAHLAVVGGPHDAHKKPAIVRPGTGAGNAPAALDVTSPSAASAANNLASPTAAAAAAAAGGLANPNGKLLKPAPRLHGALPYGWDTATFEAHCVPLHNTAHLDLQALEDEEEAAEAEELASAEAERQEKIRLREEAAQRRRERREAEEQRRAGNKLDGELSDLDENPDEVDSEEERLTARRKSAREAAGEGKSDPDDEEDDDDEEDGEDDEDDSDGERGGSKRAAKQARKAAAAERKAAEAADEVLASSEIPKSAPAKTRFLFTFCCIVCHSVLLRAKDIDRVVANQVWSKPGRNLQGKSLLRNYTDSWSSRPADDKEPRAGGAEGDDDEEDAPPQQADEEDDENAAADAPPKDEGARLREESLGVMCAGCDVYLGRYFPARDAYRLVYIQRSTGLNFMYFTGDASVARLRPAMVRRSEEEEEAEAEALAREAEQGSDEEDAAFLSRRQAQQDARDHRPVPPIVGLPFEYSDERQAAQYPFPRFGPAAPYNRPSSWQLFHAQLIDAERAAKMMADALPKTGAAAAAVAEESKDNGSSSSSAAAGRFGQTGLIPGRPAGKPSTKCNSKTFRPTIPPVPVVHSMLRRVPDSHYALPPLSDDPAAGAAVTADLSVLLWTDRVFHNRRALDSVSARVLELFRRFPAGTPYANTVSPPVPVFTHFFLPTDADFSMCRGTARYVFHFLSGKDDAKVKRVQYSYKKLLRALSKHENSVTHVSAGGWGGHRFVLAKVGAAYRIFQSNNCLDRVADRYTCAQWLGSDYPWSRLLSHEELLAFLTKFEEARRGRQHIWEELFTCGAPALKLHHSADQWQPDQVFFATAKMLDFAVQIEGANGNATGSGSSKNSKQ